MALVGQAGWEARVERIEVQQHVDNLLDELRENRTGLADFVEYHRNMAERAGAVLRLSEGPRTPERTDSLVSGAAGLVAHNYFVPLSAATTNMMGVGGLGLIHDPEVRLSLTNYAQSVESYIDFSADLSSFQLGDMRPTLARLVPVSGRLMVNALAETGIEVPVSSHQPDLAGLRSLEFQNMVLFRIGYELDLVDISKELLAEVEALIEMLESYR